MNDRLARAESGVIVNSPIVTVSVRSKHAQVCVARNPETV